MFLTRSEYGMYLNNILQCSRYLTSPFVDRGVNTFSPEGRLFQGIIYKSNEHHNLMPELVEYAIEAIKVKRLTSAYVTQKAEY